MSKYVIDLRPDCRVVQQICESDGNVGVGTASVGLLDELNDNYINEHFGSLLQDRYDQGYKDGCNVTETQAHDDAYKQGLEQGKAQEQARIWECIKKIVLNHEDGGICISELNKIFGCYTIQYVFKNYTLQQIIEKLEAYEEEQKVNIEIKVGDEVINNSTGSKGILLEPETKDMLATVIIPSQRWRTYNSRYSNLTKTGKHYDIEDLLKVMNGVTE